MGVLFIWAKEFAIGITYDNLQTLKIGRRLRKSTFFTLHDDEKNQPLSNSGSGNDGRQTAMMNETVEIEHAVINAIYLSIFLLIFIFSIWHWVKLLVIRRLKKIWDVNLPSLNLPRKLLWSAAVTSKQLLQMKDHTPWMEFHTRYEQLSWHSESG